MMLRLVLYTCLLILPHVSLHLKKLFFFSTLRPWRSDWGSLPWEHLVEAFIPILLHLNPSWNHWSVSVRFPLTSHLTKACIGLSERQYLFQKYYLTSATMATSDGWQWKRNRSLEYSGKFFWWFDKPMISFSGVFCFSASFLSFHAEDLRRG